MGSRLDISCGLFHFSMENGSLGHVMCSLHEKLALFNRYSKHKNIGTFDKVYLEARSRYNDAIEF